MTKIERLVLEVERAAHHLLNVWLQYGDNSVEGCLDHKDMTAGEEAGDWLEKYGYVKNGSWLAEITEKGQKLMDRDDL